MVVLVVVVVGPQSEIHDGQSQWVVIGRRVNRPFKTSYNKCSHVLSDNVHQNNAILLITVVLI